MYGRVQPLLVTGFAMVAMATASGFEDPKSGATVTTELNPFTKIAYIPVGADPSSIHFESIKSVSLPTESLATADPRACDDAFREPGGSMFCPFVQFRSPAPAYRITYSFTGQPMASDEYADTHFTLSVFFRPEDLSAPVRRALDERRMSRKEAASLFKLTTSRDMVPRTAIDEAKSTQCDGDYADGSWMRRESRCADKLAYRTVTEPSSYITVKIDFAGDR
jgi:hypothetical protein